MKQDVLKITALAIMLLFGGEAVFAYSQPESTPVTDDGKEIMLINDAISENKMKLDKLEEKIKTYEVAIDAKRNQAINLANEAGLLENRIEKTQLEIEATNVEISITHEELLELEKQIKDVESRIENDRILIIGILRRIQEMDERSILEFIFTTESFSEFFGYVQQLENVNSELKNVLVSAKQSHEKLNTQREAESLKLARIEELQGRLKIDAARLEDEVASKEVLIAQTQESEEQFKSLLFDVKQEQQFLDSQIAVLQKEIEKKISSTDEYGDTSILSWPVDPSYKGLSTTFYDPTYPFRHLFEHSGIDVPEPQGTPVKSAAPGYVASVKLGRLYGNYIIIIHSNGLSTLYAHLSRPLVGPEQFVTRDQVIALSGGARGSAGAGLSTGPHLHFEVRFNGIPVNPMNYLVGF